MKISIGIILLSLMTFTNAYSQSENNCKELHRGTFVYGDSEDLVKVIIKGKKHKEYHNNRKYYIKSKLVWVNDCEYDMTIKKVITRSGINQERQATMEKFKGNNEEN